MKSAAIGVSVHSGWGALVAVAGERGVEEVLLRSRVVIIDSKIAGSTQPYHYVVKKGDPAARLVWLEFSREVTPLILPAHRPQINQDRSA